MSEQPDYSRIETDRGVVWRFRQSPMGCLGVASLVAVGVPLAGASFAIVAIVAYAGRARPVALALAGLFAVQMLFVTGVAVRLGWRSLLAGLVYYFGAHELALLGERLYMGRRLGPWRLDRPRPVEELREVVLFLCRDPVSPEAQVVTCIGVVERAGEGPFPYAMNFPLEPGRALAEELTHRLAEARRKLSRHDPFPPLRVVESTLEAVENMPRPERTIWAPFPRWLHRRWWVAATLIGALGLSGLTVAVLSQPAPRPIWAVPALSAGWLMELLFLMIRLSAANRPPGKVSELQRSRQEIAPPVE